MPGTSSQVPDVGILPDVSILIVAYQSADVISAGLVAIASACTRYHYEVLLVDNGDGSTASLVGDKFPDVRIIPGQGNIGFAAGNNLLARSTNAPLLLLANPDLAMCPGAIDALIDAARRYPDAAAWGGVTLNRAGQPDIGNSVQIPSLREMAGRLFGRSHARLSDNELLFNDSKVAALSGAFVMFSRAIWDQAGGLDERYFLYCEEVDLFYRLSKTGCEFWRISSARAFHNIGHGNDLAAMRLLYRSAGMMQFARLHWPFPRQVTAFALIWLGAFVRYIIGKIAGNWDPHWRNISDGYRRVVFDPMDWYFGYDPDTGLIPKRDEPDSSRAG